MITSAVRSRVVALGSEELPAYLYDLAALRAHARRVRAALPPDVEVMYAVKANPEPPVLAALAGSVSGYEVSSGGELDHVRTVLPAARLAFSGPGKTPRELDRAVRYGIARFHVESAHELRLLAELARRQGREAEILLRVNLPIDTEELSGVPLAMGGRPAPFGLDPDDVDGCLALLAQPDFAGLRLRGIHAHLASGLGAAAQLAVAERVVAWTARLAERHRLALTEVNIGGGMAVDYADPTARFDWVAFGRGLAEILGRYPGLRLRIEPGRALSAYCGWYATEVLDVKRSQGEEFVVLRGGTHQLRTPVTKGHDQPFTVCPVDRWPYSWPRPAVRGRQASVVGQLCTPKDVFARGVRQAAGVRAGDRLVFALAGAYAWNISHHEFLMHPRPAFRFLAGSPDGFPDGSLEHSLEHSLEGSLDGCRDDVPDETEASADNARQPDPAIRQVLALACE